MKKYLDTNKENGCIGVIGSDDEGKPIEIILSGTTIYSMPIKYKNEYTDLESRKKIHFIFDDFIPQIDFYTVPLIDIFAKDNHGGFFGTLGTTIDLDDTKALICYIDKDKNVFKVADCLREFIFEFDNVNEDLWFKQPMEGITFFNSLEEAKQQFDFIDIDDKMTW